MADMALDRVDPTQLALDRAPGAPPAAKTSPADELMRRFGESQRRTEGIVAQEEREKAPLIDSAIAANREPGPAPPKLQRQSDPPKSNIQEGMQEWLMPIVALSAIAGAFSRQHATTALNAFAAGVKGLKEGNLALYEQKTKEWRDANEKLIANNEAALKEYNAVWNNRKLNIDQKMNEIALISSKYQDRLTYEAASQKNFTLVAQMLQKQEHLLGQTTLQYEKLKAQNETNIAKLEAMKTPENAQKWLTAIDREQDPQRKKMMQSAYDHIFAGVSFGNPNSVSLQRFLEENPNATAEEIQQFQLQGRPPRSAPAMALQKFMQEHPNATAEDVQKFSQEMAGATAYGRTSGGMSARVENATNEVAQLLPQAIDASRNLPRGQFVPINRILQMGEEATSNPAYNDFLMANFSLAKAYGRAMNPQGIPRVSEGAEAKAMGVLSMQTSQQAYEVQARRLWKEVQASKTATAQTRAGSGGGGDINSPVPGLDAPGAAGGGGAAPDPLGIR